MYRIIKDNPKGIKHWLTAMAVLSIWALSAGTAASSPDEKLQWHGFLTTGMVFSDIDNQYLGAINKTADFSNDFHFGLNLNYRFDHKLSFAAQVLARQDAYESPITNDWAFATYRPIDAVALRFGRQKFPVWMISDHADVGFAYPWVRPPEEVYSLAPIKAINGFGVSYQFPINVPEVSLDIIGGQSREKLRRLNNTDQEINANEVSSASLHVYHGGVTFKGTFLVAKDVDLKAHGMEFVDRENHFWSVGVKADVANFVVYSEYANITEVPNNDQFDEAKANAQAAIAKAAASGNSKDYEDAQTASVIASIMEKPLSDYKAWYLTSGYRFGPLLPHYTHAELVAPEDSIGFGSQKSNTIGCKYNFSSNADIKIETKHVNVNSKNKGFFAPVINAGDTKIEPFTVYSLVFDLVF